MLHAFKEGDHVSYTTLNGATITGYLSGFVAGGHKHGGDVPTAYIGEGSEKLSVSIRRGTSLILLSAEVYDLQEMD